MAEDYNKNFTNNQNPQSNNQPNPQEPGYEQARDPYGQPQSPYASQAQGSYSGQAQEPNIGQQGVYGQPGTYGQTQGYYNGQQGTYGPQNYQQSPGMPPYGQQPYYQQPYYGPPQDPFDAPSTGYAVLGFFFPIVGLILYLVWNDKSPKKAKSAGKGALIGVIVSVAITILAFVALIPLIGMATASYYW